MTCQDPTIDQKIQYIKSSKSALKLNPLKFHCKIKASHLLMTPKINRIFLFFFKHDTSLYIRDKFYVTWKLSIASTKIPINFRWSNHVGMSPALTSIRYIKRRVFSWATSKWTKPFFWIPEPLWPMVVKIKNIGLIHQNFWRPSQDFHQIVRHPKFYKSQIFSTYILMLKHKQNGISFRAIWMLQTSAKTIQIILTLTWIVETPNPPPTTKVNNLNIWLQQM